MARTQAEIDAAITRRREAVRAQEERDSILQIGKARVKDVGKQSKAGSTPKVKRWSSPPDFRTPSTPTSRPAGASGGVSFHFQYRPISRQAQPTINGRPLPQRNGTYGSNGTATAHASYIERPGAAELGPLEEQDRMRTPEKSASEIERSPSISELPDDTERAILGPREKFDGQPLVFSNISADAFMRAEYWRAVERCERKPSSHSLQFTIDDSEWWRAALDDPNAPAAFRDQMTAIGLTASNDLATTAITGFGPMKVDEEIAGEIISWASKLPGWREPTPIKFKSGRGGRTQYRIIAELPHELDPGGRALIVRDFCDVLADKGLMYTAVIHAPDAHNDSRNYHLHLIFHDRPARFLEEHGQWDFEVATTTQHANRHTRTTYPFRQNKVEEVAQTRPAKGEPSFVEQLRNSFAEISNTVLEASGLEKRYDPRSYKEMGVTKTPTVHLGSKAAALEAIGVPTVPGVQNAYQAWRDLEADIGRQQQIAAEIHHAQQEQWVRRIDAAGTTASEKQDSKLLLQERHEAGAVNRELWGHLQLLDLLEQKARSRADKTAKTTAKLARAIELGLEDPVTERALPKIRKRHAEAVAHLIQLDEVFDVDRPLILDIQKAKDESDKRLAAIDRELERIVANAHARRRPGPALAPVQPAQGPGLAVTPAQPKAPTETAREPGTTKTPGSPSPTKDQATPTPKPTVTRPTTPAVAATPTSRTNDAAQLAARAIDSIPVSGPLAAPPPTVTPTIAPATAPNIAPTVSRPAEPAREAAAPTSKSPAIAAKQPTAAAPSQPTPEISATPTAPAQPAQDRSPPAPPLTVPPPAEKPAVETPPVQQPPPEATPTAAPLLPLDLPPPAPAPAKPRVTQAQETELWDELINRISKERIPIDGRDGAVEQYTVPSLTPDEQRILDTPRLRSRTSARLESIYTLQRREIERLKSWLRSIEANDQEYPLDKNGIAISRAPTPIKTLIQAWRTDPSVLQVRDQVIAAKRQRAAAMPPSADRQQQPTAPGLTSPPPYMPRPSTPGQTTSARPGSVAPQQPPPPMTTPAQTRTPSTAPQSPAPSASPPRTTPPQHKPNMHPFVQAQADRRQERLAQLRTLYPPPEATKIRLVAEFLKAVRAGAAEERLALLADQIHESPEAEREMQRHGPHLQGLYDELSSTRFARIAEETRNHLRRHKSYGR